jgi:hypothetical protein
VGSSIHHPNTQAIFDIPPKISRGENYEGLPYLILDYPRFFKPDNIFAVRTMFWWGNFFSTTLHLSGLQKSTFSPNIKANWEALAQNNFYLGTGSDPWAHHFEAGNYLKIKTGESAPEGASDTSHLKLATKMALKEWPSAPDKLAKNWQLLMTICGLVATDPVK